MKNKKRLILPIKGRKIAGVSMALANYFDVDVVIFRIIWVLLLMPGGLPGIVPYAIMWVLIPDERNI